MSIEQHGRARRIELGQLILQRKKVYLDACFWIMLRDAALGICTKPATHELLHHLRAGVTSGRIVCPISAAMFIELFKQPYSLDRRIGTAQLIDELSLGVSIVSPRIVMEMEIYSFLLKAKGDIELYPMQKLIWTKIAYVLDDVYPSLTQISPEENLVIQKLFYDHLWNFSLSAIVKTIGNNSPVDDHFARLSRETNEGNALHKDELQSFAQTYDIELRGIIELAGDAVTDIIHHLAEKDAGHSLSPTPQERAETINMSRNLLYFAFKKQNTKDALRWIHTSASIHAAMRWNKTRQFKSNDYYDFEHAVAALSYCDAFLTERSLHHLVTSPQINLGAINNCCVFSNVKTAVGYIGKLVSS
jgi:hypothetical protein